MSLKWGKNILLAIGNMTQYQSSNQAKKTPVIYIHREGDEGLPPTVVPDAWELPHTLALTLFMFTEKVPTVVPDTLELPHS